MGSKRGIRLGGLLLGLWMSVAAGEFVEVDIRPDDLLSGAVDEQLRDLGRKAATEQLQVTLTAPEYWRELVEEQLAAGADGAALDIRFRKTFVESVIVRMGTRPAESVPRPAAAAPPPEPTPTPRPVAPEAPAVDVQAARAAAEDQLRQEAAEAVNRTLDDAPSVEEFAVPTMTPAIQAADAAAVMGTAEAEEPAAPEPAPAVAETPAADESSPAATEVADEPDPAPAAAEAVAPESAPVEPIAVVDEPPAEPAAPRMSEAEARKSLERRLSAGRRVTKTLSVDQVRRGDQVFTTAGVVAVVRPTRLGRTVFWLDGEIALDDPGLRRVAAGKYDVIGVLTDRSAPEPVAAAPQAPEPSPAPRRSSGKPAMATIEAEAVAEERAEMEARYNLGRPIESTVSPAGLLTNDVLYRGTELTVVVRRDKVGLKRYWLVGDLDYAREELEQTGASKFRVRRVIR